MKKPPSKGDVNKGSPNGNGDGDGAGNGNGHEHDVNVVKNASEGGDGNGATTEA